MLTKWKTASHSIQNVSHWKNQESTTYKFGSLPEFFIVQIGTKYIYSYVQQLTNKIIIIIL